MKRDEKDEVYFYGTIDQSKYDLTFVQQDFIKKNIDKLGLVDLMRATFKEDSLTERSIEYDQIRKYVAKIKRGVPSPKISPEQILFIENNAHAMKPFELAKTLFPDKEVKPLSAETQIISDYLKAVGISTNGDSQGDEYRAPKAAASLCKKINSADQLANFDANDLSPIQRKCVDSLRHYMSSARFSRFITTYDKELRELFEEEFIKATYSKHDLNTEELNAYINLCAEYVHMHQIVESKYILDAKINTCLGDTEDSSKLYMTYVDLAQSKENQLNNCKTRVQKLQESLSSTRAKRLKDQSEVNDSLTKFVEEWKSKEGRDRALAMAERQKLLVIEEVKRIEDADEYIANVMGISMDELTRN